MSLDQFDPLNRPSPAGRRQPSNNQPTRSSRPVAYADEYDDNPPPRSNKQPKQPQYLDDYDDQPAPRVVKQSIKQSAQYIDDYDDQPVSRPSKQPVKQSNQYLDDYDDQPAPSRSNKQPVKQSNQYIDDYDDQPAPQRTVKPSKKPTQYYDDDQQYDDQSSYQPSNQSSKQSAAQRSSQPLNNMRSMARALPDEDFDDVPPPRSNKQTSNQTANRAAPTRTSAVPTRSSNQPVRSHRDDDSTSDELSHEEDYDRQQPKRSVNQSTTQSKQSRPVSRAAPVRRQQDEDDDDYVDYPAARSQSNQSTTIARGAAPAARSRSPVDQIDRPRRVQYDDEDDVAEDYPRGSRRPADSYDTGPLPPGARVVRRTVIETEEIDEDDEFDENPRPKKGRAPVTRKARTRADSDDDGEVRGRRLDGTVKNTSNWAIKFAQTKSGMGLNKNCVQWAFESNGELHKVELFHSTFGGKRTIKIDGIVKVSEKKLVDNGSKYHADLPDGSLLAVEIKPVGVSGNDYQLYIDNRDYDHAKRYWLTHDDEPVKSSGRKVRELRR